MKINSLTQTVVRDPRDAKLVHSTAEPLRHAQEILLMDLLKGIENRLTGRNVERVVGSPSFTRFCVGTLTSQMAEDVAGAQHAMEMKLPRRMGARFLVRKQDVGKTSISVDFRFNVYYPVVPTWEEFRSRRASALSGEGDGASKKKPSSVDLPNSERRLEYAESWNVSLDETYRREKQDVVFSLSKFPNLRAQAEADERVLKIAGAKDEKQHFKERLPKIPLTVFGAQNPASEYEDRIRSFEGEPCLPAWQGELYISVLDLDEDLVEVSVVLQNLTIQEKFNSAWKGYFHDCRFEIGVQGSSVQPQLLHHLGKQDYRVTSHVTATGIHCPVREQSNVIRNLQIPTYVVPEQEKTERGGRARYFSDLQGPKTIELLRGLQNEMDAYGRDWEASFERIVPDAARRADPGVRKSFAEAVASFRREVTRFKAGVDALEKDEKALRAFRIANAAIQQANSFPTWHSFQLVFLVILIKDVIARERPDVLDEREYVDVLWFPTGGGKTETYLGLIAFALVYDRLRGKHRGVSAWVKFPLRMLSLDQLDRFSRVVVILNELRAKEALPGDTFEIGYFMGDRNTPNRWFEAPEHSKYGMCPAKLAERYKEATTRLGTSDEKQIAAEVSRNLSEKDGRRYHLIEKCPSCGERAYVWLDETHERTEVKCPKHGRLPIQFVDDEIYRRIPSVIISTIDKLAIIAYNDNIRNVLVRPAASCKIHGYLPSRSCPSCKGSSEKNVRIVKADEFYDPAPAVQVQDELHLLKEQLGSYNSHYESLVGHLHDKLLKDPAFRIHAAKGATKIVGATATISEYESQIAQLYGRKPSRFPVPGPTRTQNFYTKNQTQGRRIMAALWPVNMSQVVAVNEVLVSFWFRFYEHYKDLDAFGRFLSLGGLGEPLTAEERLTVLDRTATVITYYLNKQKCYIGSEEFRNALPQAAEDFRPNLKSEFALLQSETLTGDNEFRDIRRIKSRLEEGKLGTSDWLPHLAATSIISHGVDVARLNAIIMSGMPADTAEYIQASSRVGRRDLGFSLVVHNTSRDRDELHFVNHELYHEHQEFHVRGVSLNRFSKYLINRTFPGLFIALMRLYWNPTRPNETARYEMNSSDARPLLEALKDPDLKTKLLEILVEFIGRKATDEDHLRSSIQGVWEDMTKEGAANKGQVKSLNAMFPNFRPLTNHREIETPLPIGLDADSASFVEYSDYQPKAPASGSRVSDAPEETDDEEESVPEEGI